MACGGCAQRRKAAGERRPTLLRLERVMFEVVSPDGVRSAPYDTVEEARDNRGAGQIRRRVDYEDVAAAYSLRVDGAEVARFDRAADAAAASKQTAGSTVHMVAADSPVE